jgi:hypothetical protein
VWDVPLRSVIGGRFKIKIGAKCASSCPLTDRRIEVYDETGVGLTAARLGEVPWPGTVALYWAEVDLPAPASEGVHCWTARFTPAEPSGLVEAASAPHSAVSATFSFLTVPPPDRFVTVHVIDRESRTPVSGAIVRVGPYRACTDEDGLAKIEIAKGRYDVTIYKVDYESFAQTVELNDHARIDIELQFAPRLEDAYWG